MNAQAVPIPEGHHGVTPYLTVAGAVSAIDFYTKVFGATEVFRFESPGGRIGHAELSIGGTVVYLSDEFPDMDVRGPLTVGGTPVMLLNLDTGESRNSNLFYDRQQALYVSTFELKSLSSGTQ